MYQKASMRGQRATHRDLWASKQAWALEGLSKGSESLLEGFDGLSEGLKGSSLGLEDLLKRSEGLREKAEGLPEGSKSLSEGLLGRTYRCICKRNFPHSKDFVPYWGRYPKTDSVLEIFSLLFVANPKCSKVIHLQSFPFYGCTTTDNKQHPPWQIIAYCRIVYHIADKNTKLNH